MKKSLFSILVLAAVLSGCDSTRKTAGAEKPENCAGVLCTQQLAAVTLRVSDPSGNPASLDEAYTVRKSTNETIRYERSLGGPGSYTVLDDSYRRSLAGKTDDFRFVGRRDGVTVVDETVRITADCCHVKRVDGKAEVVVPK